MPGNRKQISLGGDTRHPKLWSCRGMGETPGPESLPKAGCKADCRVNHRARKQGSMPFPDSVGSSHLWELSVSFTSHQSPKILSLIGAWLGCCSQASSKVTLNVPAFVRVRKEPGQHTPHSHLSSVVLQIEM